MIKLTEPQQQTVNLNRRFTASNPWFWGSMTRQQFEQELQKSAVLLLPGNATRRVKPAPKPVEVPKFDKEAIHARRMKLTAAGVKVSSAPVAVSQR